MSLSRVCIETVFYRATIPEFFGSPVTVGTSFELGYRDASMGSEEGKVRSALLAIDFSSCNPSDEIAPGFYSISIFFGPDGSAIAASTDVGPMASEGASCIESKIRDAARISPSSAPRRGMRALIRIAQSTRGDRY